MHITIKYWYSAGAKSNGVELVHINMPRQISQLPWSWNPNNMRPMTIAWDYLAAESFAWGRKDP